ncbi:MAG TPA: SRPBCC family protein [Candidatus Limnocylindrales bacterium]|nr:SRPBCC family protein [Candidatus Limnocylindrales bacterium]
MRSEVATDVDAAADLVFDLARDVSRWERLLPHYSRSRPLDGHGGGGILCEFVARRELVPFVGLGLPVAWRSRTWAEPATRRLRFRHVGGATAGMDVTWRIEPTAAGSRILIEHDFAPRMPGWALVVDRLFVRPIAGRTLATFKALAEAISEA